MTERRRAKGEGTVRERSDGLWEAREPPEIVPFGEKPRNFCGKSKSEAVRTLREALRERERGFSPSIDRITVSEYLERWIEGPLRESASEKTRDNYARVCRKYPQELLGLKWPDLMVPEAPGSPSEMQLMRRVSMSSEGLKIVEGLKGGRARKRSAEPSTSCPRPSPH